MPIFYECDRCTACCRWPGQVPLTDEEIAAISKFLGLSDFDFIQEYTRIRADRKGLALTEQPGGECVFLDGADCRINAVKPRQCRAFPNLWNFPGFQEICRARPKTMDEGEYSAAVARVLATGR